MEKAEFGQMCDKALEQLMKGQPLTGKNGLFAPLPILTSFPDAEIQI